MNRARLVAEVSSNHNRDLERSLRFVAAAAGVGCDAVKFQQFRIEELFSAEALAVHPHLLERQAWELPESFNAELAACAREHGIEFSSTPFYRDAVAVLEPHVDFFKLASYQVLWLDLFAEVAATGKPVVLATGMATLDEVHAAVDVLTQNGCRDLTLLHCVSAYPTPPDETNLAAIETLRESFGLPVGWSDHTVNQNVVVRAVHRYGATMVEMHFDLDGGGEEFGGGHCWLPAEIVALRMALENDSPLPDWDPSDGDGSKAPQPSEAIERMWRTDPSDGLRPLREVRAELIRAGAA